MLSSCSASAEGDDVQSDPITCDGLQDEAVRISENEAVQLLKVRTMKVDLDKQATGWETPKGADEVVILRCIGQGVWSDGGSDNVRLELRVDADDEFFIYYQATM
jgi:hypothetical protein